MAVIVPPSALPPQRSHVTLTPPLIQGAGPDTSGGDVVLTTSDGACGPTHVFLIPSSRLLRRIADLLAAHYEVLWLPDPSYLEHVMGSRFVEFEWELARMVNSADASLVARGDLSPNEWRRSPYEVARNGVRSLPGPVTDRPAQ